MSSRKAVMTNKPGPVFNEISETSLLSMSGSEGVATYFPPHINYETADFGYNAQSFVEQFYVSAKRPVPELKEAQGGKVNGLTLPANARRDRQLARGEFEGPILLRKRQGCAEPLPSDLEERQKVLFYEASIHRGEVMPSWRSNEDAELMTKLWEKDTEFAKEARAFFYDHPQVAEMNNKISSSKIYVQTAWGKVFIREDQVEVSGSGQYRFKNLSSELKKFLIATEDQSTMVDSSVLQKEMDLQEGWVYKPRTYEQKEADQRNLVDEKLKEHFGKCTFCGITWITSGYKNCGHYIVCNECAEKAKLEPNQSYKCPLCGAISPCLVTPYHV